MGYGIYPELLLIKNYLKTVKINLSKPFTPTFSQGMFSHLHGFCPSLLLSTQSMHPEMNNTHRNKVCTLKSM